MLLILELVIHKNKDCLVNAEIKINSIGYKIVNLFFI